MKFSLDFVRLCVFFSIFKLIIGGVHQRRLLESLFLNYDPLERPVADESETLNVSVGLAIQQIVDVDEKKQTIIFSGWLDMTWFDYNLRWNPEDYGNISTIRITSSSIWIPDLLLYNSADDSFDATSKVNAVLHYTGEVNYLPPGMFKSTCPIKIDDFPFDEQNCPLKFGSWTHDEATINLKNKSNRAQLDSYIKNGEWYLEDVTSYSESIAYECCPTKYPFVMFVINIRRRTLYFIFNLIFPCILISFMSVLGFSLPPESGEKIGLEITTLLSIIMFSQIITGLIPESSLSVPKISLYFASVMVISAMSIIANVIVLIFHHKNLKIQHALPRYVEIIICKYLAKLLRMKKPKRGPRSSYETPKLITTKSENDLNSKSLLANVLDLNDDLLNNKSSSIFNRYNHRVIKSSLINSKKTYSNHSINNYMNQNFNSNNNIHSQRDYGYSGAESIYESVFTSPNTSKEDINLVRKNLTAILKEIRLITQKLKDDEEDEAKSLNWKFAAMVIDRLCLVMFSVVTFISTFVILFTSKNFFKPSDPDNVY